MTLRPPAWTAPADWHRITTIDAHTAGEPFRVVTSGWPDLPGDTIVARRRHARLHHDDLRTALMWEPRGHADMYGCVLTPPVSRGATLGVLFMHNEGFSTMCGHGIIALATVLVEARMVPVTEPETEIRIDTPAGLVTARARLAGGRVASVAFHNVPSFVFALDQRVVVPDLGEVAYDLAFGGAFYAYVRAADLGLACTTSRLEGLVRSAAAIKAEVNRTRPVEHPFEPELSFLYGVVFTGPGGHAGTHTRNVCVFADGEVDRSPTGTSVSAQLALLRARGLAAAGQPFVFESVLGTRFGGRIAAETTFGPYAAVIPEVEGSAHITGRHEFVIDPADPLGRGFLLR